MKAKLNKTKIFSFQIIMKAKNNNFLSKTKIKSKIILKNGCRLIDKMFRKIQLINLHWNRVVILNPCWRKYVRLKVTLKMQSNHHHHFIKIRILIFVTIYMIIIFLFMINNFTEATNQQIAINSEINKDQDQICYKT